MKDLQKKCRVAVIQAAPVFFNKEKTIDKVCALIKKAAQGGAQLVVFPESYISGYPRGLSFGTVPGKRPQKGREDWKRLYDNAIIVPSADTERIATAVKAAGVYAGVGYAERDAVNYTLYCGYAYFAPDGTLLGKHRKVKPTGMERCLWGEGCADTLKAVDTPWGPMGALCCWENLMPLARMTMYQQGVTIHLAPTMGSNEVWQCCMRHIAFEGRCFVISANHYVTKSMYQGAGMNYEIDAEAYPNEVICPGGSSVVAPDGNFVVGPVYGDVDIVYADLDMDMVTLWRMDFDPTGHYSRPDLFKFHLNTDA
ncbi:MAG: carbon-nitrogen hydrolase family protein [Pyramidobacter sp.]|nr:carbon-nitrogen hydrolase family protein [Pyramidobacter sp.]